MRSTGRIASARTLTAALMVAAFASPSARGAMRRPRSSPDKWKRAERRLDLDLGGDAGSPTRESEAAVDRALEWLWRHQAADGHWDGESTFKGKKYEPDDPGENTDPGVTGLALLAFLGAGNTDKSGKEKFQKTVRMGVRWLMLKQAPDGSIGKGYEGKLGYNHPIAGLALAEACGMSKTPRIRRAAQKAVDYSVRVHQSPKGGWRYKPRMKADTSVTGWFVQQLHAAKAVGIRVPRSSFAGAGRFLDSCTKRDGSVSYKPREKGTPSMTAVGLLCRELMGSRSGSARVTGAAGHLLRDLPKREGFSINFHYWYYGTLAMYHVGGEHWQAWGEAIREALVARQRAGDPSVAGSWDPIGFWCASGGRVYSTAMAALCLEVCYRHPRVYE